MKKLNWEGERASLAPSRSTTVKLCNILYIFIPEKPGRYIYELGSIEDVDESCKEWFKNENEANVRSNVSEPCPCTKEQAVLDGRFVTDADMPGCYITRHEKLETKQICCYQEYVSDCLANQGITLSS